MFEQTIMLREDPDVVLERCREYFQTEWDFPGELQGGSMVEAAGGERVLHWFTRAKIIPYSSAGWALVIIAGILTMGTAWLIYFGLKFLNAGSPRESLVIHIYPRPGGC